MGTPPRILVANGNDDVLAALDEALSDAGYEVKTIHVRAMRLGEVDFATLFRESPAGGGNCRHRPAISGELGVAARRS